MRQHTTFLDLGLKFQLQPLYSKIEKEVEIEILYQNTLELERSNKINANNDLADHLRSESKKHRNYNKNSIITPRLRNAAKKLKNN